MPRPSRKHDLLNAGIEAVLTLGAAQTTIDSVCTEVGVTKGAFFHHFKDKDDFIAALLLGFGERGAAVLAAVDHSSQATAAAQLHAYLDALGRMYGSDPWFRRGCLFLIVAQEYGRGSAVRQLCKQGLERWLKASTDEFRAISSRTGRRPAVSERQLAEQLLYTIEGALHVGRTRNVKGSIHRALQQYERYAREVLYLS